MGRRMGKQGRNVKGQRSMGAQGEVNDTFRSCQLFSAPSRMVPIPVQNASHPMRYILAGLAFAAVLCGSVSAQAERRIFIIANNADGYGVDRCLATGASCGVAVATAYCKSRDFTQAQSFHKLDREEITGAVRSISESCRGDSCDQFVAIECTR
jgi:hypothetical protein